MNKQTKVWLVISLVLGLLALGSACGNKPSEETKSETSTATKKMPAGAASIVGIVTFIGTPPTPKKIDTSADPVCGQKNPNLTTDDAVIKDGKVANVFVYIKDGSLADGSKIGDYTSDVPSQAVTLDQNGCHYRPHVLGIQTNQKLQVTNSDPTQHNIHPTPKNNPEWNQTQPNGAPPIEKTFARAEILIPVKCNQHPWMKAYIGVLKHPFFSVSGEDGSYTIKGVPAGTYTVVAWREGGAAGTEKTMQVTVPATGSAKADFSFGEAAAAAGRPSTLEVMPALEIPLRH
ncbi:MAG TPA: carboxypeptidase regulatory-like domain-containing protein [Pyrinomonadaceae bacterium]|nr:carboxypeptidase regulatory-like domain-containing protein [Pyrinomonadaceae bacterium]